MKEVKYLVLIGDGMGDYPLEALGGKTPLEVADTPNLDALCGRGEVGLVQTIPKGMEPGSDVANMSLLGYDPRVYHTGRAPLEAASIGVKLGPEDVAFRCNLVTLEEDGNGMLRMADYSAGHISTPEALELITSLQEAGSNLPLSLYPGVSYRHLLVWHGGKAELPTTPPHDITGQAVGSYCKVYQQEPILQQFIQKAKDILSEHRINQIRIAQNKKPANSVWLWGQGKAPSLPSLEQRYGLRGIVISAVDLLKGLGIYAGLRPISVLGATGYLDTNYNGKVKAALEGLKTGNFVYLHIEAPDETGHEGDITKKIQAIEDFDKKVVGPIIDGIGKYEKVNILIAADHLTPIAVRTHVSDPTIYLIVRQGAEQKFDSHQGRPFTEKEAASSGLFWKSGVELFDHFVRF